MAGSGSKIAAMMTASGASRTTKAPSLSSRANTPTTRTVVITASASGFSTTITIRR